MEFSKVIKEKLEALPTGENLDDIRAMEFIRQAARKLEEEQDAGKKGPLDSEAKEKKKR